MIKIIISILALGHVSLACIGHISEQEKATILNELHQDLEQNEYSGNSLEIEEVLSNRVSVGIRGNCNAVAATQFIKFKVHLNNSICWGTAASEMRRGHFTSNETRHITNIDGCVDGH